MLWNQGIPYILMNYETGLKFSQVGPTNWRWHERDDHICHKLPFILPPHFIKSLNKSTISYLSSHTSQQCLYYNKMYGVLTTSFWKVLHKTYVTGKDKPDSCSLLYHSTEFLKTCYPTTVALQTCRILPVW